MARTGKGPNPRRSGPVVDRVRALRARELHHSNHTPAPVGSDAAPMPEPGQEWAFILAGLQHRADAQTSHDDEE